VLAVFAAGGALPDEASVEAHFAPPFLAAIPAGQLVAVFGQLAIQQGRMTLVRVAPGATATALEAEVSTEKAGAMRIVLSTEPGAAGRMVGLLFQPAPPDSWDQVDQRLRAVAPRVNLLAAEIGDGTCRPIHAVEPATPLAVGSTFKLYVLAALARSVARGERSWSDPLAIDEARKSLPSGAMRDENSGTTFSLRHYAEQMISVSDNTAADHLLFQVGREAVEAVVGGADPRDVPFLSTREMFLFKLDLDPDEQQAWLAADVPGKRAGLAAWGARALDPAMKAAATWTLPRHIGDVEWFASPDALCSLGLALKAETEQPKTAAVASILAINPGIPDPSGEWAWIGYKGGSEPGVLNLTWLLRRRSDDRWFFLTVGMNDDQAPLDQAAGIAAAGSARAFLAGCCASGGKP
jgi:hypothetical protein